MQGFIQLFTNEHKSVSNILNQGVLQHIEAGMNCAEFSKSGGSQCHTWLLEVMQEFLDDNLSTGAICQPDIVIGRNCPQPQTFMQVSMMYEFFVRAFSNYGQQLNGNGLLTGIPENLFNYGIQKTNNRKIVYRGNHAALLDCTTNSDRTSLQSCEYADAGDGEILYEHNINSLLSALLIGHYFDPSLQFCGLVNEAWSSTSKIINTWSTVNTNDAGWTKATSQMMSVSNNNAAFSTLRCLICSYFYTVDGLWSRDDGLLCSIITTTESSSNTDGTNNSTNY